MNDKIIITAEDRGIVIDGDIVEPPEADIIEWTPKLRRIERRKRLKYKIKKFFPELIRKIKYRFRKTFNIKNDIPKLMSQVEIKAEDRLDPKSFDNHADTDLINEPILLEKKLIKIASTVPGVEAYAVGFSEEEHTKDLEKSQLCYEVNVNKHEAIRRLKARHK